MTNKTLSIQSFLQVPIVGIVRDVTLEDFINILPLYHAAGLRNIEVTMNTPDAESLIAYATDHYLGKLNVGAGTVYSIDILKKALKAGASYIIAPNIEPNVISQCIKKEILIIPGAMTPSEIYNAWRLGASLVKLFPASLLGVQYVKDLQAPFDFIKLMPTGGIDVQNFRAFLDAGAVSVGIGSHLFDKKMISDKNWKGMQDHFNRFSNR